MYLDIIVHYVHVFTCNRYNSLVLLLRTFIVFKVISRWRHQYVLKVRLHGATSFATCCAILPQQIARKNVVERNLQQIRTCSILLSNYKDILLM